MSSSSPAVGCGTVALIKLNAMDDLNKNRSWN